MQGEKLADYLRSLLQTAPTGVPLERLDAEFYTLFGTHIFLGTHKDLQCLLRTMPDVCSLQTSRDGRITVTHAPTKRVWITVPPLNSKPPSARRNYSHQYSTPLPSFWQQKQGEPCSSRGGDTQFRRSMRKLSNWGDSGEHIKEAVSTKRLNGTTGARSARLSSSPKSPFKSMMAPPRNSSMFGDEERTDDLMASCTNAAAILDMYCSQNSLPPPKIHIKEQRATKHVEGSFLCVIDFKGKKFQSYPEMFSSALKARDYTAAKVLADLGVDMRRPLHPPADLKPRRLRLKMETPEQIQIVVTKLLRILEKKPSGVFCNAVAQLFAEVFGAELPEDWMIKIEGNPQLEVMTNGVADVLYKKTVSIRSNPKNYKKIAELTFPREGAAIFVTNVVSANLFRGLVDNERRQMMDTKLSAVYCQEKIAKALQLKSFEEPVVGNLYATFAVRWCRVQCVKAGTVSEPAKFRFVDCGLVQPIMKDEIHHLSDDFYSFPFFLVDFRFEEFADIDESKANDPVILAGIKRSILLKQVRAVPPPDCDLSVRPVPVKVFSKAGSRIRIELDQVE